MRDYLPEEEIEPSFDLAQLRDRISYSWRAIARHPWVVIAVAALTIVSAVAVAQVLPDRYQVETRLIAQQDDLIAALSNPGRPQLADEVNPATRTVSDMVLRRDNLLAIIDQTDLLRHWRATRSPLFQLKDWLVFRHRLSDEELTEVLVGTLEKRITATAEPGAVITFAVVWEDPALAEKIAGMVMSNFIDSRNINKMAILAETITLLEQQLQEAGKAMDETLVSARASQRTPRTVPRSTPPSVVAPSIAESVELARLRSDIVQKRRALDDLVSLKQRTVADLQAQLASQRAIYSDTHPVVANLRRSIETMSADSPQILQARKELADLEARYAAQGGSAATLEGLPVVAQPQTGGDAAATASLLQVLDTASRDPGEEYARSRLTSAVAGYYSIADRLQAARIERDAARANIKYRYTIIKPPLPPRQSTTSGYRTALIVLGIFFAPFVGVAAALSVELLRGRVTQAWQLERSLGLPVIAFLPGSEPRS